MRCLHQLTIVTGFLVACSTHSFGGDWLALGDAGDALDGDVCAECCDGDSFACFASTIDITYDTFRGMTDVGRPDNSGLTVGTNVAFQLLKSRGINAQIGVSHGVYDWRGRINTTTGNAIDKTMRQTFLTAGLFHQADRAADENVSWGIVHDWMVGGNWGLVGDDDITLSQWRGQISYALNDRTEVGLLGMLDGRDAIGGRAGRGTVNHYQTINQINLFLDRRFSSGADGRLWIGIPEGSALDRPGSTIDLLLGASATMPLNDYWAANGSFMYGNPSASGNQFNFGQDASTQIYTSVAFGVTFYPGGRACKTNPLMRVANNRSFLIDNGRVQTRRGQGGEG